jgi:L-fuculose-phosphate aldolase
MMLEDARKQVVEYCRKFASSKLGSGTSGNISVFVRGEKLMAISPSSMHYAEMEAGDVVLMDLAGAVVDSARRPSTEWAMHLGCYRARQDLDALVHTHSPAATTLAVLGQELPAVHYMIALSGGSVVPLAPYHLYGSEELAEAAVTAMAGGKACLLQSHGVLAGGPDIHGAWALAEQIEFCAEIYLRAKAVGEPNILDEKQIEAVIGQLESYRPQH